MAHWDPSSGAPGREPLTALLEKVLARFKERAGAGLPAPTYKELCAEFGWRSTRAAGAHVDALVRKGYLKSWQGTTGRRGAFVDAPAVELTLRSDPQDTRRAGRGVSPIQVPKYLLPTGGGEAFVFQVPDTSMVGAGIYPADLAVVRVAGDPRRGDLVVVVDGEGLAVRRVEEAGGRLSLTSAPADSKPSHSSPLRKQALRGTVVSLMRNYEAARDD
jgi:repressor LexA